MTTPVHINPIAELIKAHAVIGIPLPDVDMWERGAEEAQRRDFEAGILAAQRDDDDICLCDAYAQHRRPGRCPIHGAPR